MQFWESLRLREKKPIWKVNPLCVLFPNANAIRRLCTATYDVPSMFLYVCLRKSQLCVYFILRWFIKCAFLLCRTDRARSMPGAKSLQKEEQERERTKRTNRMLISMVIIFGISWLPLNCHNLIQDFYMPAASWRYSAAFFLLAHAVAMSSCCYNPFLYAWLNENFRKEFKLVLPCFDSVRLTSMGSERKTAREDKFKPNGFPKVESTTNAQESRLPQEYIPLEGLNTPSTQTTPLHQTPKHW